MEWLLGVKTLLNTFYIVVHLVFSTTTYRAASFSITITEMRKPGILSVSLSVTCKGRMNTAEQFNSVLEVHPLNHIAV